MGHRYLAELVILLLRRAIEDLALRPLRDTDDAAARAPLPPPMLRVRASWNLGTLPALSSQRLRLLCCLILGARFVAPRLPQNNWPNQNNSCLVGSHFTDHIVAKDGFEWVNDGSAENPKWGW